MMVTVTKWLIIKQMTQALSHSVAVSIQETGSQLTDELPIIAYNKVTVKNTDYQDQF